MANNLKKYVSDNTLSALVAKIKELFATKSELSAKADSSHSHTIANVMNLQSSLDSKVPTSRTINSKPLSANITLSASDVGAAASSHSHDDRYYTETEIDQKLAAKSDTTHHHDSKYDAKGSASAVQTNLDTVSDTLNSHTENTGIHVTTTNKTNWNTAYTHSQAAHARADATKVADSTTNGNILINGTETTVYSHPNSGVSAGTYKSVTVNAQGHVTGGSNPTTLSGYGITDAETKFDANAKLTEAKTYADNAASAVKNDLLNNAGAAYDTLKELGDLIDDNKDAIDALEEIAAGKANATHTHAIADVTNLQSVLDGKAATSHGTHVSYSTTAPVMDGTASAGSASTVARSDHKHPTDTSRASKTEFDSHAADTTKHITATERTNWNAAKTHADSAHAPSNAEKNQNAFSNIAVSGQTTVAADSATDTITFVGSNVTITTDATNDKVTFSVADGSTSGKGVVQLTNSTSSTSTTTAATPSSVKSAYDLANTAKTNAATAQTRADNAYALAESKVDSLSDLGVTATATELNYVDGVTSNIQTQLDGKAATPHNHSASNITSGTLSSDRLPTVPVAKGGTGATDASTARTNLGITPENIGAMPAIDAISSSYNMDTILSSGAHYALYRTNVSTLGTPYKKGITTSSNALILSYAGNNVLGTQIAYVPGVATFIRYMENSVIGDWTEVPTDIYSKSEVDTKISGKANSSHNHSASNITSGTLAVERGGTGNMDGYVRAGALSGTSIGALATAEGRRVTASGSYSHAEGNYTEASGSSAHAEGQSSTASGIASHAEGNNATASGSYSHAEGDFTNASAKCAHAEGTYTLASSDYQHVQGKFNIEDKAGIYAHIVGNGTGTSSSSRSNAHTLDWNGNAWFKGNIYVGGTSQSNGSMLASVASMTTAQYNALETANEVNANTLYMLTDAEEEVVPQIQMITWGADD